MAAIPTTPPTVAPAITPAFEDEDECDLEVGLAAFDVEAAEAPSLPPPLIVPPPSAGRDELVDELLNGELLGGKLFV